MLRPNSVPRAASGGTVTACSPAGVLGLRPIAVARFSGYIELRRASPGRARLRRARRSRAQGRNRSRIRRSRAASARTSCVQHDLGDAGQRPRRRVERSQLVKHLGDLLVVHDRRARMQPARVVLVDQPWPVVVLVDARGGRFILPDAAKSVSCHEGDFNGNRGTLDSPPQECGSLISSFATKVGQYAYLLRRQQPAHAARDLHDPPSRVRSLSTGSRRGVRVRRRVLAG